MTVSYPLLLAGRIGLVTGCVVHRGERTDVNQGIEEVLEILPGHGDRIRSLVQDDELFRELCADYAECAAALRRFRAFGADAAAQVAQYSELRADLEKELVAAVTRGHLRKANHEKAP